MSTQQRYHDSSLNNEPECDARELANARITTGYEKSTGESIPNDIEEKMDAPIDKQGDTLGGGISFVNKQVR